MQTGWGRKAALALQDRVYGTGHVFDRRHAIDPTRTYAAGLGDGARLACALAFTLPEYIGGVGAIGGGAAPFLDDYLRHRAQDRLSVAVVSGAD